jgi:Asp-tRNA(Asn)/Glu-tRNA(Gln) amidotransferase A subunit family amidase
MYIAMAPLGETLYDLQERQHSLSLYVEQQCLRIDKVNPQIEALLPEADRNARLRAEAVELRNKYSDPRRRPLLYGALVGIKDIIYVDGFPTRAGSKVPVEQDVPEATVVRLLRQAGALIAGKTVTTEFAYIEPGPTRNPYNTEHTPGGSSSGSAAAVAAGLCTLAVGTQTIGSVIRPAAYCGIVGFKPSFERIPTDGILYFSRSVDHIGLFTQDVLGMAQAAAALCRDWRFPATPTEPPVLGVPDGPYLEQTEPEALRIFEEQLLM